MRLMLMACSMLALVATASGCGDDTTTPAAADMTAIADMSATPHDMQTLNCSQIISCTIACQGACAQQCIAEGKQGSGQKATLFFTCAISACTTDGGQDPVCLGTTIQNGLGGSGVCASQGTACASDQ